MIFEFGDYELDADRLELRRAGRATHLEPQVFAVLRHLVEHRDRVVPKEELLDDIWGDRFVSESALTSRIKAARKAVGDTGRAQRLIRTSHGVGYRFTAPVVVRSTGGDVRTDPGRTSAPQRADEQPGTSRSRARGPTTDSFIGRDDELARLEAALRDGGLVTLTGPGGVGKTRLASEYLVEGHGERLVVDLSRVTDPGAVPGHFLGALGASPRREVDDIDRIVETLELRSLLVVVDNCEQVVEPVAAIVSRLLVDAPDVRILATSRLPLGVRGERILNIQPLGLPPPRAPLDEQLAAAAVRLFVDRADRAGGTVDDLRAAAALCRHLDGIPLALELAAARTRTFSPGQILEQLESGWPMSTARRDDAVGHHRSLEEAIDWSYRLLDDDERSLLGALSSFRGPFDVAAVAAVTGVVPMLAADLLARLVDRSLVQSTDGPEGRRLRLLETVRRFAASRVEQVEAPQMRDRHAAHFARRVDELSAWVPGPREDVALAQLGVEFDDVTVAFDHCVTHGDLDTAVRLATGPRLVLTAEGARWARLALRAVDVAGIEGHPGEVAIVASATWGAILLGDLDRARSLAARGIDLVGDPSRHPRLCWIWPQASGDSFERGAEACLEGARIADESGDAAAASFLLSTSAIYCLVLGDDRRAADTAQRALVLARSIGSRSLRARAAGMLAYALEDLDPGGARRAAEEVLAVAAAGDLHLNLPHRVLAALAWRDGDPTGAADHASRAGSLIRDQGDRFVQAVAMRQLAVLVGDTDPSIAAELLGVADAIVPGVTMIARDAAADAALRSMLTRVLGEAQFAVLLERGRRADARAASTTAQRAIDGLRAAPRIRRRPDSRDRAGSR